MATATNAMVAARNRCGSISKLLNEATDNCSDKKDSFRVDGECSVVVERVRQYTSVVDLYINTAAFELNSVARHPYFMGRLVQSFSRSM